MRIKEGGERVTWREPAAQAGDAPCVIPILMDVVKKLAPSLFSDNSVHGAEGPDIVPFGEVKGSQVGVAPNPTRPDTKVGPRRLPHRELRQTKTTQLPRRGSYHCRTARSLPN